MTTRILPPTLDAAPTMAARLALLAATRADDRALVQVDADGDTPFSYAQLHRRAGGVAAVLAAHPGQRVLLLLDSGIDYVAGFFGCLYAGAIAVPAFPPESAREQHLARLRSIADDAEAAVVLTSSAVLAKLGDAIASIAGAASIVAVDTLGEAADAMPAAAGLQAETVAFLQYTSGSTSAPKGVIVTNGNLWANEIAIQDGLGVGPDDTFVSWLPLFHDMGLIGGMLQPIFSGIPLVLMSPQFFLERPVRWLDAITRHRGTISGGPDFSYRLCCDRVRDAQAAGLDLSSWRVAFSGSEPVRRDTLDDFVEQFAPRGFASGAVYPCYGLAEATLFVTGVVRGAGMTVSAFDSARLALGEAVALGADAPDDAVTPLVGCGATVEAHTVRLVGEDGQTVLPDGRVGEIWACGPSIAQGYWNNAAATDATFVARDGERWLRTGDLGLRVDGQLYVVGRKKDMIIVRGQNLFPEDIERAIERELDLVRKGRISAFGTDRGGREGVGVAVEISRGTQKLVEPAKIVAALNEVVSLACGEPLAVAVLLNPGALPKTSSGKLQRAATRLGWRDGTLDAYAVSEYGRFVVGDAPAATPADAQAAPAGELETALAAIWQDVLGCALPLRTDSFLALGGNSLAAVQVVSRVRETWGVPYDAISLFEQPRLDRAAAAIAALLAGGAQPVAPAGRIDARDPAAPLALSHAQQRQWFLWNLDRHSSAYHIDGALTLRGALDVAALHASFDAIAARHESLRTRFVADAQGDAVQVIDPLTSVDFREADFAASGAGEAGADAWADALVAEPFDLTAGKLLRVGIARLADDAHRLVLVMHHIVSDGWSVGVLLRELADGYRARVEGGVAEAAALPVQYADYAAWQRRWLAAGEEARQLAYWRERLGGEQPVLALPADRPRQAVGAYRAARLALPIPAGLALALRGVAHARHATLFMTLLAGFDALLHRYTGEAEIRVGVPVANRNRVEIEGLIGFFVNTQVLKADIDRTTTLGGLLDQVRRHALEAQAHQDLPFDVLVDALQPERSLSHTPLFQVAFNHLAQDPGVLGAMPGLSIERHALGEGAAQFELMLETQEAADGSLVATLRYARELFDADTMARFGRHYLRMLEALTHDLQAGVDAVPLLDEHDQRDVLALSRVDRTYAEQRPVHEVIRAQVEATPDAVAVEFGADNLTYRELDARVNRLAHRLMSLGVGVETRVGIAVERSVEMVVGLLAILKAGGAYVPLDPEYPQDRLAYMIEDSGVALLLTQSHVRASLPIPAGLSALDLDTLDLSSESDKDPGVAVDVENAAYVIYTSGSTGRPKGAVNRHVALTNRIVWMQDAYQLDATDTVLQKTPFSFDVSVWEFFWPLMVGAKLAVAKPGDHRDPARLVELIQKHDVTTLHFVPPMLQAFVAHDDAARCTGLKRIVCSGEALPAELANRALALLPNVGVFNLYGPTEAAIDVTHWTCVAGADNVPIGRPIANIQTYVLDDALNLAPRGVAGELYLGGVGLARGYLNRPGLTAERFVADPFGTNGERLYRTGDLARWNADGALEYLGRIDHQVKIRGFRIELGEIESQLTAQAEVREAVVTAQTGAGGARLIAYVTAAEGETIDVPALRAKLGETLPDYMVPSVLMVLDAMPLNPNGKVDRKLLPKPEAESAVAYAAPEGDAEQALATLWSDVLGVAQVGRHDNFFELGGDSILSLKVVARASAAGLTITPRQVFERQTVAGLAELARPQPGASSLPPLLAVPRDAALPLSYAQQRLWFLWNLYPHSTAYHVAGGLTLKGEADPDALRASLAAIVARHEPLRTTFAANADGSARQIVHAQLDYACRDIDLRDRPDAREAARAWAAELAAEPFDLLNGPLLKAGIARVADGEHWLAISMHHIVSDGWSIGVLLDELLGGYRARLNGDAAALPALAIQYADYAVWQRTLLDAGERARQLAYWRDQLGHDDHVLSLPADRPRGALASYRAQALPIALPAGVGERVRRFAQRHNATPFMVLLAAFDAVLYRHSGQTDIRVGVPIANRERPEIAPLIGFFVNTQVLRAGLDGQTPLGTLLAQVRTHALDAQAHQDLPFDVLVDALQPERSLSHTPLFQVMFNHQKDDARALAGWPGLQVGTFVAEGGEAQFELKLDTVERGDGDWSATLTYAGDLFERETIERFGRHYVAILTQLLDAPATRVGDVALLDERERGDLLALSRVDRTYAEQRPVHEVIRAQVEVTPDAVAVEFGSEALTYRELDARANRLAHRLMSLGVGVETRVGIAVERSVEMVVGLLAILKAGGAYVPLDPEYPQDRLAYMIEDSGVALLLTQSHVRVALPIPAGLSALDLDTLDLSSESDKDPGVAVDVENAAYVIYTSGSTGRPKGAVNRHVALTNRIVWMQDAYRLDETDTVLQKTPFSFDVSVWEFFWPLMVGAKLAVAKPGDHRDPARLVELIQAHGVTTLHFVPPMLQAFVAHDGSSQCTGLKRIVCSGEALPAELANRALTLLPNVGVFNLYGPTEAAIDVTHWTCVAGADNVPIGRPIANIQTYVLDDALNLVPRGVAGELYLGGVGLARGYLNRPGLTAERFVADPFGTNGERLYRTGDLARWNAAGALEYLGRIDHQVKIRGFRIELGEIESQLTAQAKVREAVVTAQTGAGGARLIGYVTAAEGETIDVPALRAKLGETLPDYMVPSVLMVLEALPLNPNGKVDRKLLPKPEAESAVAYAAPEGDAEQALAALWADVLGVAQVGRHDNFFELGGDSILSLQIVARAREAGWKVTPRQVFERQTIALLAQAAQRATPAATQADVEQGEVALLPIQRWFFDAPVANRHHWNQAVLLEGEQPLDAAALSTALDTLVAHHGALRLRFAQEASGAWRQSYGMHESAAAQAAVLWEREAADTAQAEALCEAAQASLNLHDGPLLRALLIRLPAGAWRLLLVVHHLAVDGVSWRILLDDLQSAYAQARDGHRIALPSNGTSYRAWSARLADPAMQEAAAATLPYWQAVLDTPAAIPADRPLVANTAGAQRIDSVALTPEATRALLQEVPAAYRTQINDVLLTALGRALSAWAGTDTIRVDLEGHGREDLFDDVDLSRTVGWFTSLYPVTLDALGEPGAALKRVKEALRAVPQRGLSFGLLKYRGTAAQRAALSAAESSTVVFNYLGQLDRAVASDWRLSAEPVGPMRDAASPAMHALNIDARIDGGALHVDFTYRGERFSDVAIQRLAGSLRDELVALIAHCTSGASGVTPSDFPLTTLTQAALDALPISVAAIEDLYPLSPMQAGMVFHTLTARSGGEYVTQLRVDVAGVDPVRFEAAWQAASARHPALRSAFVPAETGWLQWVAREATVPFAHLDWRDRTHDDATLRAFADAELARGFDLAVPPLQRVALIATGEHRHHLVWTHHHALIDGWSVAQLLAEVLRLHAGDRLPAPAGRYRDYLDWLAQRNAQAAQAFWRGRLAELSAPTRVTGAQAGRADGVRRAITQTVLLDASLTARIGAFARSERVTVNTVFQAAWALLLRGITGQSPVVFGATVAGRPDDLPEAGAIVGLFINTIPVVARPLGAQTVGDWLRELQADAVASHEHAHAPLHEIQRWAGSAVDGLFDTLLVFENYPIDAVLTDGSRTGLEFGVPQARDETNYPLTVSITLGERMRLDYTHASDLLETRTVAAWAERTRILLDALTRDAARAVGTIELADVAERRALLALSGNGIADDLARLDATPVHERIAARARQTPDAIAVVHGERSLAYGELDALANRLAHRLAKHGVGPDVSVGIAVERSIEMVVGILATLKAGGAYVPLDPDYPADRLAYMIEDSRIGLILSQRSVQARLPAAAQASVLDLDTLDLSSEPDSAPATATAVDAANLAYVIYTSGSTGRPKGVGLPHGAFARHVSVAIGMFDLTHDDRVLQFSTLNFDGFVEQLFPALSVGACVVLRGPELWDGAVFREQVIRHAISVADVTTAYWQLLVQDLESGRLPDLGGLRRLHAGGEAMSPQTLHRWHRLPAGAIALANTYGPTEAAVTATLQDCSTPAPDGARLATVPIGRPLGGRQIHLLDAAFSMVPPGAIGELCIGGELLARGYLNRPGLTAERFVPDPFNAGARLYRTGDLARWNAQGELEYLGRIDHQVKVRGFRIELGEIDTQLLAQAGVREAITIAEARPSGTRLVAYVSPQAGQRLDAAALRDGLAAAMPDYMVPSVIVVLDALPLNPNGKIDRRALPDAGQEVPREAEPPQGEHEIAIAAIWQDVLEMDRVGRHDNFFALGGHSLLAMQLVARINHQFKLDMPVENVFTASTLQRLAADVAAAQPTNAAIDDRLDALSSFLDVLEG